MGNISFNIAKFNNNSKIYLVDIDCLILEFTEFRFKKHRIDVEVIPVTKNNIYPELPKHNICITADVMEHLFRPMIAYNNIYSAMIPNGLLYGDFNNRYKEMFHVHPDLYELRNRLKSDFNRIGNLYYQKKENIDNL